MTKTTKVSRAAQAISGITLLAIAVTAGATGLKINVFHGLERSLDAAVLFGLADLTKIVLPIVCGIIGWTMQTRLVALVCVGTSLFCVVVALNSATDGKMVGKQHGADQYASAKAAVETAEARVASLDAQVAKEAKNKGCGNACKALKQEASQARSELSAAKAAYAAAKPVAVSSAEIMTDRVSSILALVLIEALVWMSVPAMSLLSQAFAKRKATIRKSRKVRKPIRKTEKQIAKLRSFTEAPKLTKSGNVDQRTKQARAVKRVTSRVMA